MVAFPVCHLAGKPAGSVCEQCPGRLGAVPCLGPSRSFPTRWRQRCCSGTSQVTQSAQCDCARFSFSQNLWLWGWGMGFPIDCNMEGFFWLDFFTAFVIGMLGLLCRLLFTYLVFCGFFSGTTQEGSHCKRGGSLMGGMVLWPVCSQDRKSVV